MSNINLKNKHTGNSIKQYLKNNSIVQHTEMITMSKVKLKIIFESILTDAMLSFSNLFSLWEKEMCCHTSKYLSQEFHFSAPVYTR